VACCLRISASSTLCCSASRSSDSACSCAATSHLAWAIPT
jgi:hypothetical protein